MKQPLIFFIFLCSLISWSQTEPQWKNGAFIFTPEILMGLTMEANDGFPETGMQKQVVVNFGRSHQNNPQQWAQRTKGPKTGLSMGVTDFGNLDSLGVALTAMPFLEFNAFRSKNWKVFTGMGASYFTKKFHPVTNPQNRAVTTDLTWAFRLYLLHKFLSTQNIDWRLGLGYSHHSNGHTRLLNLGYNSFLLSLSAEIHNQSSRIILLNETIPSYKNTIYEYLELRGGLGQNAFALAFNDRKNVYTFSGQYGRVYDNTFKIGIGFYYRFYQHYYDYIEANESLVQEGREFDYFRGNSLYYASNFGISLHGEVLLNHVGIDLQLGYNFHKPAYKLDWRINEGWDNTPREIPKSWQLGELGAKYKKKYRISSRLGLKYYLIGTEKTPKNNFYIGAHLNANLGQADFTEMSFGYVHRFNLRERP